MEQKVNFPHLNKFIRKDYPITTEAIDDWFKRCVEDRPIFEMPENPNPINVCYALLQYISSEKYWYHTWFDQFNNSLVENED